VRSSLPISVAMLSSSDERASVCLAPDKNTRADACLSRCDG